MASSVDSDHASTTNSPEASQNQAEAASSLTEKSSDASTILSQSDQEVSDPTSSNSHNDPSEIIPVEKNVFYNQETLKYMRVIDKYKRLEVADIELPRVRKNQYFLVGISLLIFAACGCWCSKFREIELA